MKAATQKPAILAWLLALAILAGGAGGAHADLWYVHYDNALRTRAHEDWRTAVAKLSTRVAAFVRRARGGEPPSAALAPDRGSIHWRRCSKDVEESGNTLHCRSAIL